MAPSATTTTVQEQQLPTLKLRSDGPSEPQVQFPEGTALADLSRGPNPLMGEIEVKIE